MKFESPDAAAVLGVADQLGVRMSAADADSLAALLAPVADGYARLEAMDSGLPIIHYARPSMRPQPADNPFNAWYVKTAFRETDFGPLAGRRIAVKDNIMVAKVPMMNGTRMLEGFVPDCDATVVRRLLEAGAEIAGKSVCEALCLSGGSSTSATGPVENPHKPGYSTGGSSSGSAALVAGGNVDYALGTDQGGSVRVPASWCGIVGMKATTGVVPYEGAAQMEARIDDIGPLTRTVHENADLLDVLAGRSGPRVDAGMRYGRLIGRPVTQLKVGVLREGFGHPIGHADVDHLVRGGAKRLAAAGAKVADISVPMHLDGVAIWNAIVNDGFWQSFKLGGQGYNHEGWYSQTLYAAMASWRDHFHALPDNARMLMTLGAWLERYQGRYYGLGRNHAQRLRAAYDTAFEEVDLLLLPTAVQRPGRNPDPAATDYGADIIAQTFNNTLNTSQFNATGHPAISVPVGMSQGLPVGLMLVGRFHEEALIYQAAQALEQSFKAAAA